MWTAIAAIVGAISSGIRLAAEWLARGRDNLLLSLGGSRQEAKDLRGRIDGLEKANKLREEARANAERAGDSVLSDDGFRRDD
jgi:hypothetical protein